MNPILALVHKHHAMASGGAPNTGEPDTDGLGADERKHHAAKALIDAVHGNDAEAVLEAFEDLFSACESEPHEEGEHISDEE
jgi:hypothetical protein